MRISELLLKFWLCDYYQSLGSSCHLATTISGHYNTSRDCFQSFELGVLVSSVLKLQRWWRHVLLRKLKRKSVIIIQSHIRGWAARKKLSREKHCVVVIQVRFSSSFVLYTIIHGKMRWTVINMLTAIKSCTCLLYFFINRPWTLSNYFYIKNSTADKLILALTISLLSIQKL